MHLGNFAMHRWERKLAAALRAWGQLRWTLEVGNVLIKSEFYQTQLPSAESSSQFDDDEIYNVDFDNKTARWRLPRFGDLASANTAGALQNKAVNMQNLKVDMERTNNTAAKPADLINLQGKPGAVIPADLSRRRSGSKDAVRPGPSVTSRSCDRDVTAGPGRIANLRPTAACSAETSEVTPTIQIFTENPVVLNEPNQLICLVKRIFPPVIKMSWMKNNQPVTVGVSETDFYFASDLSYYKFLYLATIPKEGDMYTCSVEHAGLPKNPTNKLWSKEHHKASCMTFKCFSWHILVAFFYLLHNLYFIHAAFSAT
ncbi:unnamed protein product [Ranitomeya imitator]|uniref:Ig-like domain-containing protein n=1 Tax=Ranitomeya imitator TaxID=111125 RepID=A0ABN9LXN8_9NEOB|nr:unnamed protein product [Ranitomeya imitator]